MMKNILKVENVWGGYDQEDIIKGVSIDVNSGDFLGIIGPNGSGKSTLLKLASRALNIRKGLIYYEGADIRLMKLKEYSRKIAFVAQDVFVDFSFTAWEIVLMGRIPHLGRLEFETSKDFAAVENAMKLTSTLNLKDKFIDELSAGERQRVMIAKALAQEPALLLLDEPTSHLDIGHQIQTLDLLRKLNRQNGLTIIIVMHDLNLAGEYCNRLALIRDGSVFREGDPDQVLTYQNIESVYDTVVVVNKNPVTKKPYVIAVPEESICRRE
jgi:iron complex transport system ATP-binding protein